MMGYTLLLRRYSEISINRINLGIVEAYSKLSEEMGGCEQALKPINSQEGYMKKYHSRQPDLGNPAVRDENGGLMKCKLW